jgi:iron complex outermembrane recepter protein
MPKRSVCYAFGEQVVKSATDHFCAERYEQLATHPKSAAGFLKELRSPVFGAQGATHRLHHEAQNSRVPALFLDPQFDALFEVCSGLGFVRLRQRHVMARFTTVKPGDRIDFMGDFSFACLTQLKFSQGFEQQSSRCPIDAGWHNGWHRTKLIFFEVDAKWFEVHSPVESFLKALLAATPVNGRKSRLNGLSHMQLSCIWLLNDSFVRYHLGVRRHSRFRILSVWLMSAATFSAAGEVSSPELITQVEIVPPSSPPLRDHVLVEFTVTVDGHVSEVSVIESSDRAWDQAVQNGLELFRFRPAIHDAVPVAVRSRLSFTTRANVQNADASIQSEDAGTAEKHPEHVLSTTVVGRSIPKSRGASDFSIDVGELGVVPRKSAADFLKLAPGILLSNEGGEGHPDQIFLRGFDAKEGQDIELSVDGVPINELGNLHGNGYSDLNFIIPELVENLRVVEGPFDPRQGNFAVAGSADYQLGLSNRGLLLKGSVGSFGSYRLVSTWGPSGESKRTFGGVQIFSTQGFGENRSARNAKFAVQYEGQLSNSASFRVGALGYSASFKSAGLLRYDDVLEGRQDYLSSYDTRQGGESSRAQLHFDIHGHGEAVTFDNAVFAVFRDSRLQENFTGFLFDPQLPQQNPHQQRGDLLDRNSTSFSVGSRGLARYRGRLFNRNQDIEVGYLGRFELVRGLQYRIESQGNIPYARDYDLDSHVTDIGLYADANVSPWWCMAIRGGVRGEFLNYSVLNLCAVKTVRRPSVTNPPGDASCLDQRDFGRYRESSERNQAGGLALLPRLSILIGPFKGFTFSGSVGQGIRSIDPQFISENLETPFSSILSYEGGVALERKIGPIDSNLRAVAFGTRVDKDVIFNEQAGRGVLGGSTTRLGMLLAGRGRGDFFDVSSSFTWVQSQFDETKQLVPYVPDVVLRTDVAFFGQVPIVRPLESHIHLRAGLGLTAVGRRALPFGQRSNAIVTLDASMELTWQNILIGFTASNLFDARYSLGDYNFASNFQSAHSLPTLVPARHFSAGTPRTLLFSLGVRFGGES